MKSDLFSTEVLNSRFISEKFISVESPTLILLLGMHGNETAGIEAVNKILNGIESQGKWGEFKGNLYVIKANVKALEKAVRYQDVDLNRLWEPEQVERVMAKETNLNSEEKEQKELIGVLNKILKTHTGKIYFADMHTTSSVTPPFIVHLDSKENRRFSSYFSTSVVLGIEDFIKGTLFDFIDDKVEVSIVFEAGQHQAESSVTASENFILKLLEVTQLLPLESIKDISSSNTNIEAGLSHKKSVFRIVYRHRIENGVAFKMKAGFVNFQKIEQSEILAWYDAKEVRAKEEAYIFMPLYQDKGSDGFFTIIKVTT